jgi:hypothetical protein
VCAKETSIPEEKDYFEDVKETAERQKMAS